MEHRAPNLSYTYISDSIWVPCFEKQRRRRWFDRRRRKDHGLEHLHSTSGRPWISDWHKHWPTRTFSSSIFSRSWKWEQMIRNRNTFRLVTGRTTKVTYLMLMNWALAKIPERYAMVWIRITGAELTEVAFFHRNSRKVERKDGWRLRR